MYNINNLEHNNNLEIVEQKENITVFKQVKDLSLSGISSQTAYYNSKMNICKRQVRIILDNNAYTISAGAMQWTCGNLEMTSDIKGVGDMVGKMFSSKATKEGAIKPKYSGTGVLMLEPTYKYILLEEVSDWNGLVLEDGLFLACDSNVKQKTVMRSNVSSALVGNEGLFNLCLEGKGIAILESFVPREELLEVELTNDTLKIDGNMAIAWSKSLDFRVEKSGKSLMGSAVSGEGLVNVYKGTGKVLMVPIK